MKKQSNSVTKEELRQIKAYLKFQQVEEEAEINRRTDKYSHMADTRRMDCTIYNDDDYELFSAYVRNKALFQDMFTAEQWEAIESGIKLYEMNGHQKLVVKEEQFDIVDSLASESAIAEIAKKIGKK